MLRWRQNPCLLMANPAPPRSAPAFTREARSGTPITVATKTEVELKYDVPADFNLPDLAAVPGVADVGEPAERQLDAVYFDTPDLRLAAHRVTLRRRSGGSDAGWHIKRPSGTDRTESHFELTKSLTEVPEQVAAQVRAYSRAKALQPVARIQTRRIERPLCDATGTVLALVAEDAVSSESTGENPVVQQWRELEVELVDGTRKVLAAVDEALQAAGARSAQLPSKLARALADRFPREAQESGDATPAVKALTGYLREQRDALLANESAAGDGDVNAVHDMRVAARRLRSTLRTFRPLLQRERTEPLREELRWLGAALGAVRDGQVMAKRLRTAVTALAPELVVGPVAARIQQRLANRTGLAREDLKKALDSPRYAALLDRLDEILDNGPPPDTTTERVLRLARKALRRADRMLDAAGEARPTDHTRVSFPVAAPSDRDSQLHEARKAYKRARYAVEALKPLAGKQAKRLANRLTTLQDILGTHQDSVVTGSLLRDYGMRAHLEGENAFTYGLLHGRQTEAGERCLRKVRRARRRATGRRLRGWLRPKGNKP
jgi:CHAD domain-containing protein